MAGGGWSGEVIRVHQAASLGQSLQTEESVSAVVEKSVSSMISENLMEIRVLVLS
jgi:hypothetical protein